MKDPEFLLLRTPMTGLAWPPDARAERVFLHGDAVERARHAPPSACNVEVCSTSWRRRFGECSPMAPAHLATLASLIDALSQGLVLQSVGLGGRSGPVQKADGRLLLEIGFAPVDEWQRREALELALAAAAFEFEADVVFTGAGSEHLSSEAGRGWGQLIDFGLMRLWAEEGQHGFLAGVMSLESGQLDVLRQRDPIRLVL